MNNDMITNLPFSNLQPHHNALPVMLDLQMVPTKLFTHLGPYLITKGQLDVKSNILLKALKANKISSICNIF